MTLRRLLRAIMRMLRGGVVAILAVSAVSAACAGVAVAAVPPASALADVAFDQHLGAHLPMSASFLDEQGRATTLAGVLGGRPAIVLLGYYECPNLCSTLRQSLLASLARIDLTPDAQYRVIAVSIDPAESGADAANARAALATVDSGTTGASTLAGWHFLTGPPASTGALAASVGFHYVRDAEAQQYAHPSGIVVVTPAGRVSRYFFGVDYPPAQLRASLLAATDGTVASPVQALLLRCFHFDPVAGRHSATVIDAFRVLALLSIAALLIGVARLRRRAQHPMAGSP